MKTFKRKRVATGAGRGKRGGRGGLPAYCRRLRSIESAMQNGEEN